jgi:hypothetical protein
MSKGNQPRNHHYVPRFYLEGFCDPRLLKRDDDHVLWVYEKGKDIRKSAPHKEATMRDFYTYKGANGKPDLRVENALGTIEENAARIMRNLNWKKSFLPEQDRQWLALFVGTLFTRTRMGRAILDTRSGPAAEQQILDAAQDPERFRTLLSDCPPDFTTNVDIEDVRMRILGGRLSAIGRSADFSAISVLYVGSMCGEELLKMDWQFVYAHEEELFVTSDSPVMSAVWQPDGTAQFRSGFGVPGVDIYLPLSRDVCLRMTKGVDPGTCVVIDRGVRAINKLIMTCADKRLYAAERSVTLQTVFEQYGCQVPAEAFQPRWEGPHLT